MLWPTVGVWSFVATILAVTSSVVRPAEVRASIKTNDVIFYAGTEDARRAFSAIPSTSVTLTGFSSLELGDGTLNETGTGKPQNVTLEPAARRASVTLFQASITNLAFPEGTTSAKIAIHWTDSDPSALRLEISPVTSVEIGATHSRGVSCNYCILHNGAAFEGRAAFTSSEELGTAAYATPEDRRLLINLELRSPDGWRLQPIYLSQPPGQHRRDGNELQFQHTENGVSRSSILGGRILIPGYREKPVQLSVGTPLIFQQLQDFRLRELRIANGLQITMDGTVGVLRLKEESLLPSVLDRWIESRRVTVYVGVALALGALTVTGFILLNQLRQRI